MLPLYFCNMNFSCKTAFPRFVVLIILVASGIWATGCGPDKNTIIRDTVQERTEKFRKRELANCRQELLKEAERKADSLLLAEAQAAIRDSTRNRLPVKPQAPPPLLPIDSSQVKPIFKDSGNR